MAYLLNSCPDCNQSYKKYSWCQNCNSKRFQQDFDKWTSGNELIDNFIKDTQLKAIHYDQVVEWIPYNKFRNIKFLAEGGFGTIDSAIWLDGIIIGWDRGKQQWKRCPSLELKDEDYKIAEQENVKSPLNENEKYGNYVVLKRLNNSENIHKDFLNEWESYWKFICNSKGIINFIGISKDPETLKYMVVMPYIKLGSLQSNLMTKKYNPNDKYNNLHTVAYNLSQLHKCDLVHGDFHSGNLLLRTNDSIYITDFGLCKPADKSPAESEEIYGALPYVAPEVIRGKPYTKASDIYSFGIIMWEMTSGIPARDGFNEKDDICLTIKICKGARPEIIEGTEDEYVKLMERCWDSDPEKRPEAEEIFDKFGEWERNFPYNNERIGPEPPENKSAVKKYPPSYYTSKRIGYSKELNKILSQKGLSSSNTSTGIDYSAELSGILSRKELNSNIIDNETNLSDDYDELMI